MVSFSAGNDCLRPGVATGKVPAATKVSAAALHDVRSVLIGLTEHLGDIVACEPVVRSLKELYPGAKIVWAVREPYRELIDSNPNIDETLVVDCITEWILLSESGLFDKVFDLHIPPRGCPVCKISLKRKKALEITCKNYFFYGGLLDAISLLAGITVKDVQPRVYIQDYAVRRVDELRLPDGYVVFHCESIDPRKVWSAENWARLSSLISGEAGIPVIEVGSNPVLQEGIGLNLCGRLSILETAEVIRRAALFVAIDSGPAHLANALGALGVILLGRYANFDRYLPYTGHYAGGRKADIIFNDKGLVSEITVEQAWMAVRKRLEVENRIKGKSSRFAGKDAVCEPGNNKAITGLDGHVARRKTPDGWDTGSEAASFPTRTGATPKGGKACRAEERLDQALRRAIKITARNYHNSRARTKRDHTAILSRLWLKVKNWKSYILSILICSSHGRKVLLMYYRIRIKFSKADVKLIQDEVWKD